MKDRIAYCGIDCAECPAYKATQADDDAQRAKVAGMWSKMFKTEIPAAAINCDGCRQSEGRLFGHCLSCSVRMCAMGKGLGSCGKCSEYSCEKLNGLLSMLPMKEPRKNLEAIRESL